MNFVCSGDFKYFYHEKCIIVKIFDIPVIFIEDYLLKNTIHDILLQKFEILIWMTISIKFQFFFKVIFYLDDIFYETEF